MLAPLAALVLKASDPWLGVDKLKHVAASAVVSGDAYWLSVGSGAPPLKRVAWGLGSALTAGAVKEIVWDLALHHGDPSWRDFAADALGALIGTGISILIDHLVVHPRKP